MANVLVAGNGRHFSPTSANLRTNHQWNCYDYQRTELFSLSCVQNNNQRLYEDMILIDDDDRGLDGWGPGWFFTLLYHEPH